MHAANLQAVLNGRTLSRLSKLLNTTLVATFKDPSVPVFKGYMKLAIWTGEEFVDPHTDQAHRLIPVSISPLDESWTIPIKLAAGHKRSNC